MRIVTFGELLAEYNEQKGWGTAKFLKERRYVPLEDVQSAGRPS